MGAYMNDWLLVEGDSTILSERCHVRISAAFVECRAESAHYEHTATNGLLMLHADSKAKQRALDAGLAYAMAKVLAAKLDENHMLAVRVRMLISDLLRVPDMQVGCSRIIVDSTGCAFCSVHAMQLWLVV